MGIEGLMDDEAIDFPVAPKKPYVRPQLHELSGSDGAGKAISAAEFRTTFGPS